jgi:hypothetical protein
MTQSNHFHIYQKHNQTIDNRASEFLDQVAGQGFPAVSHGMQITQVRVEAGGIQQAVDFIENEHIPLVYQFGPDNGPAPGYAESVAFVPDMLGMAEKQVFRGLGDDAVMEFSANGKKRDFNASF